MVQEQNTNASQNDWGHLKNCKKKNNNNYSIQAVQHLSSRNVLIVAGKNLASPQVSILPFQLL